MAKKQKSFEEQLVRLREIHSSLENGNLPLEDMLVAYEEGMKLVSELQEFLEKTEQRVVDITKRYSIQQDDLEDDSEADSEDDSEANSEANSEDSDDSDEF